MIAKTNVIYQKDRRIRLPEVIEKNLRLVGGQSNLDILIKDDIIEIRKSKYCKPNSYANKSKEKSYAKK